MSTKTTIALFLILFAIGLILIVLLPFFLTAIRSGEPGRAAEEPPEEEAAAPPPESASVFRSDDGGRSWQSAGLAGVRINHLMADPADPATLFAATDGAGLFVSRNRGEEWEPVRDGAGALQPEASVFAVAVNPARRGEWYLAVFQDRRGRVLRTLDGGATFREVYVAALDRFGVFDIHYDGARGAVSIATGQGGYLESTDQGRTWRVVRWFADGLVRLLADPARPGTRFVATSRGNLFRTTDFGGDWADVSAGYNAFSGSRANQRWAMDHAGALYLGSSHGLLRSRDRGLNFSGPPLIIPPDALPILAIAVHPRDRSRIVVSAANQLYGSRDDGETWAILASPADRNITHLVFDAGRAETIYAVAQP